MISRYTHRALTWIDLECPTREELAVVSEEFSLHPVIASELLQPSERTKVDLYENALYLVLHFPIRNRATGHISQAEVDFVLLDNTLITTHYELVDPLHDFGKRFEVGAYLDHGLRGTHAGFLFFFAARELYKHTLFLIESENRSIREIEKEIFGGNEADMVMRISKANRGLIDMRETLRYHKETLASFAQAAAKVYGDDFSYYAMSLSGDYERTISAVEESRQMLRDLRETNDSLLSSKTTATIRRLTAVNVIILPLTFMTGLFGMDSNLLRLDHPRELLAVFGGMALIFIVSLAYFRSKKWL